MSHDIGDRAFTFAVTLVTLRSEEWYREMATREVLRQLVRAGTSVGANLTEASGAQSKADFIAKASIARKEVLEAQFWLRVGSAGGILTPAEVVTLQSQVVPLGRIVSAIVRSAKRNPSRGND